ncbi:nitric oxide reductase activation protein [Thermonema lapsum]|jgi:nitric oxide reductase activation protein|uniref:Nitric oxide reductase activation protein n=1 Tax=Thermonema lapsum TaxID=28195 RepID=A0A846MQ43_9BACT|nr:hypothetical protein [Thermonema lapsum]NIK73683.1 nitric oxide reductase activation protein [Thermonema lapsum]
MDIRFYWEQYNSNRPHEVSEATFRSLCLLYPVVYVLTADGKLDLVERHFLKQMEKSSDSGNDLLHLEVLHIAQNRDAYRPLFVDALHDLLQKGDIKADTIFHSMLLAARCSYNDWKNNAIYAQYPAWAEVPVKLLAVFLQASEEKSSLSEAEKQAIVEMMEALTGDATPYAQEIEAADL